MPIFDQGYQHWKGPLSGHSWRWLVVARHGVKAQLKGKIVRILLFTAWVPALALVTALVLWGLLEQHAESVLKFLSNLLPAQMIAQPREYRTAVWTVCYSFFFKAELGCSLILVMVVGPNLISRDLRFNAFPLYFSRPLRRIDYFLGKLGVIGFYLAATAVVPAVVAYVLGVAFSLDLRVIRDTHRLLWAGILYGLIITASAGTLMLALSALSRRSIYVGLAWAAFCFLTMMVSGILIEVRYDTERHNVFQKKMERWAAANPPPKGVEPMGMFGHRTTGVNQASAAEREAVQRWINDRGAATQRFFIESESIRNDPREWRAVCSYASNLDRLGDWLFDADAAWVVFGRTMERPRAAFGPAMNMQSFGRMISELSQPPNDRVLADRMVWQYPWYWSAGVLGGLWLVSVFILTRRVKSLDRLK